MTTHDEKILQLLDRIHATDLGRREQTIDGAVQTMERVNRTSYGALRDLIENGHKKAAPAPRARSARQNDAWLPDNEPAPDPTRRPLPFVEQASAPPVAIAAFPIAVQASLGSQEAADVEITRVMANASAERTEITPAPQPASGVTAFNREAAHVPHPDEAREPTPGNVVSGDGASYAGDGSAYRQTQVFWFRRLFRRR